MKKILYLIIVNLIFSLTNAQPPVSDFKLKEIHQLSYSNQGDYETYGGRFELSGMTDSGRGIYCVSDDIFGIFELDTINWTLKNTKFLKNKPDADYDFEAVSADNRKVYLAAERRYDEIFSLHCKKLKKRGLSLPDLISDFNKSNTGVEGMDYADGNFYVSDEGYKDKKHLISHGCIYKIDADKNVTELHKAAGDITELKYVKKGDAEYIYYLERNNSQIVRLNLKSKETLTKSYLKYEKKNGIQNLYDSGKPYGMGEALIITKHEIWVGFDNGKSELSDSNNPVLNQFLKLRNQKHPKMPIILIFEREDF